jgi:RNA polymerase sigma-70 factor (ECF subfamily)
VLTYEEQDILKEISGGNETAFKKLFNEWQPRLSSFIFKISKSRELTEEIVQDVFLKIWMTRENLENIDNFKAYLFTACKNHALNAVKKNLLELQKLQKIELQLNLTEDGFFHESIDDKFSFIDRAIQSLSDRQKQVYLLSRYEKLTYQEIADRLGIGKESVKTHMKHAIASITEIIKNRNLVLLAILNHISENF